MNENTNTQIFGKKLKMLLERENRTQSELAEYCGVSAGAVTNWIRGKKFPRPAKIEKITEFLGCTKDDLLLEPVNPPDDAEGFGDKLNYYLLKAGKSQSDLARDLGVTSSAVNQWINQGHIPHINMVQKIAAILGVKVNELIGDSINTGDLEPTDELFEKRKLLFDKSQKASAEDLDKIIDIVDIILGDKKN